MLGIPSHSRRQDGIEGVIEPKTMSVWCRYDTTHVDVILSRISGVTSFMVAWPVFGFYTLCQGIAKSSSLVVPVRGFSMYIAH